MWIFDIDSCFDVVFVIFVILSVNQLFCLFCFVSSQAAEGSRQFLCWGANMCLWMVKANANACSCLQMMTKRVLAGRRWKRTARMRQSCDCKRNPPQTRCPRPRRRKLGQRSLLLSITYSRYIFRRLRCQRVSNQVFIDSTIHATCFIGHLNDGFSWLGYGDLAML